MCLPSNKNQVNAELGLFEIDITEWWVSEFSEKDRSTIFDLLQQKKFDFYAFGRETIFNKYSFQIKDEAIIPFLENLSIWLNQHKDISHKIFLKFLDISQLDPIADCQKLENDKVYRNWFILRHLSLYSIHCQRKMGVESAEFNYGNYELASDTCKELSGKSFSFNSDLDFILSHWSEFKPTCRCILLPNYEDILID